ncbi:MAG TPA: phosphate acyltransferase PlsX [Steroidobacteraceae bacterium]|nr:phosphate acyltransferase PlsX [Steroidobacteraceae bacterium]
MLVVAIDVMSGDLSAHERIAGAVRALRADAELGALLVGARESIETALRGLPEALQQRIEVVPAAQVIRMDEAPRSAVRRGRESSMRIAVNLVREGRAAACISAGNTGALTAIAHFVLKTVGQVERAALMAALPSVSGQTQMLDLGANTRATPLQLAQFARMGAIVARDVHALEYPRVGLLNVGEEEGKGHEAVQAAHALIAREAAEQRLPLRYVGFIEGDDIFSGEVDVVVTDGFTGNVALKAMEGLAQLIGERVRREFAASLRDRLAGLLAAPVLRRLAAGLDPRRHNGACMVGLRGIVVKSHGSAGALAFARAIEFAAQAARAGLTAHMAQAFEAQGC